MPGPFAPIDRLIAAPHPLRRLPRWAAALVLLAFALAIAWAALGQGVSPASRASSAVAPAQAASAAPPTDGDLALYRRINARVRGGEGYYAAAVAEQRAANYPTRPFYTVRLPTMAWISARLGERAWQALAVLLLIANALAWTVALREGTRLFERLGVAVLVMLGGAGALTEQAGLFHDLVTGLLLSLALALYRPARWWPSLVLLALALALRELALPFALLWLAFAVVQNRPREGLALIALLAAYSLALAAHAHAVEALLLASDPPSQGWSGLGGVPLFAGAVARLTGLLLLPPALGAALAVLPMLGWLAPGGRTGTFAVVLFSGYALAIGLFARPENFYWALLVLPAYAAGLAFVPRALADLGRALSAAKETRI